MIFEDLGVPPSATAFIGSGRMPEWLAGCFDPAQTWRPDPDWPDVADLIEEKLDSADPSVRGVLALMVAHGQIAECEMVLDAVDERVERIHALLDIAEANGITRSETDPLRFAAHRLIKYHGEDYEDEEEDEDEGEDGEEDDETLLAGLKAADASYRAGDRAAALARYRDIAHADLHPDGVGWITEAWAALIADAAEHEGPAAARDLWRTARLRDHLFPWRYSTRPLIERLLGRGIPEIVAEAVAILRHRAAGYAGSLGWRDRELLARAMVEIESSGTGR